MGNCTRSIVYAIVKVRQRHACFRLEFRQEKMLMILIMMIASFPLSVFCNRRRSSICAGVNESELGVYQSEILMPP